MRISTILMIVVLLAIISGITGWYFSTYEQTKRQLRAALEDISNTSNAMDLPGLQAKLGSYLADGTTIKLSMTYKVFGAGSNIRPWTKEFTREEFSAFIGEMTGRVETYGMHLDLKELTLNDAGDGFTAQIDAPGFATGSLMMMTRNTAVRYVISGECAVVGTLASDSPKLTAMDCTTHISQQADLSKVNLKNTLQEVRGLKP